MPLTLPFRAVFAVFAVALSCCACVLALLKSVLRAECPAPPAAAAIVPWSSRVWGWQRFALWPAAHLVKSRT